MINKAQSVAVKRLFEGMDAERYTLPHELVDARARVARVDAAVAALRPHGAEQAARAAAVVAALDDPDDADLTGPILAARADDEAAKIHAMVLREAQATAGDALTRAAVACSGSIMVDHLRPKLEQVLDQARSAHQVFSPFGGSEADLFTTPPKVRAAWVTFINAAADYGALVAAKSVLHALGGNVLQDTNGYFSLVKNTEQVWPDLVESRLPQSILTRPWPAEGGQKFLIWALTAGAELWLPSAAEQDQRWAEVFGARVAEHQQANKVMGQYRELVV